TSNALDDTHNGVWDGFVAKLQPDGRELVYSTYLGGTGTEADTSVAVSDDGGVVLAGGTGSVDFPTTQDALQPDLRGQSDAYIARLSADGQELLYSTFLGGQRSDNATAITIAPNDDWVVAGVTESDDFPVANAADPLYSGEGDAFVTRLTAGGTLVRSSSFFGGVGIDFSLDVALDPDGNAILTGRTSSPDLPILWPLQGDLRGPADAFLAIFYADGRPLFFSTYLGGSADSHSESGTGVAVDEDGHVYVTGYTEAVDFPVKNALQSENAGPVFNQNAFVAKVAAGPLATFTPTGTATPGPSPTSTATATATPTATWTPSATSTSTPSVTPTIDPSAILVTTTEDGVDREDECTLRQAIQAANQDQPVGGCPAGDGADLIILPAGDYALTIEGRDEDGATTGDLDITESLAIRGAGSELTTVDGNMLDRIFDVFTTTVSIDHVTIRNGGGGWDGEEAHFEDGAGIRNRGRLDLNHSALLHNSWGATYGRLRGGGIFSTGALTIAHSAVLSNQLGSMDDAVLLGGGIYNEGTIRIVRSQLSHNSEGGEYARSSGSGLYTTGLVVVDDSAIDNNSASSWFGNGHGGGIWNSGTVMLTRSSVSENSAGSRGGGWGGGIVNGGVMTVTNSTISSNEAWSGSDPPSGPGGIANAGSLWLLNTTVAYNSSDNGPDGIGYGGTVILRNSILARNDDWACSGTLTSEGYNLIDDPENCSIVGVTTGNQIGADPMLGPLQENGGPTRTHV
ncbi:MAG TPA: SBBP repeat-containing protein, partial [Ardenticatenaceae bacterium]|nr:SBBP repeat-containing protein [Ardenticatenaceae bacterium]